MSVSLGIAAVVVLVAMTAVFAAAETVLTRLGIIRALALDDEGRRGAASLLWLIEHPALGLNAVLLLTIVSRVAALTVLVVLATQHGASVTVLAAACFALASFVLAEVAPRTFTLRNLERVGLLLAPPVAAVARLLAPLLHVLIRLGSAAAGSRVSGPFADDDELRRLIGTSEDDDEIDIEDEERAMIHSIFELGDTVCREIMVPRPDMVTVNVLDPLQTVVETAVSSGYSRIPVWGDDPDHITGVVYAKDLLQRLHESGNTGGWVDLCREPTFVPESKRADELLRELRRQKVHLAVVVDEYGGVAGIVTIEDILEEIVGEIVDEYDHEEPPVVRLDDRRLRVAARVTVHDLNEMLDVALPEDEGWDTVGGLLMGMLGRVPEEGESARVDGVELTAERVQGRRVERVLVTVSPGIAAEPRS